MHPREMNLRTHSKRMEDKNGLSGFIHENLKLENTIYASDIQWINELKYIHIIDYIHSNEKRNSAAQNMSESRKLMMREGSNIT